MAKDHVFLFKTAELCPIIEEFSAILGYDPSKTFVAISCDLDIGRLYLVF